MTAILTLALGIGATTAMFSLINAVLLKPLPFPHPDRLTWIAYDDHALGGNGEDTFSYRNFFDFRERQHSFQAIASYRGSGNTLLGAGEARQVNSRIVSSDFFRVLGGRPFAGRDFERRDENLNVHTVMLGWDLWQHAFGGRRDLIGGTINLDGAAYEVAGVMPAGFSFPIQSPPPDLWIAAGQDSQNFAEGMWLNRSAGFLDVIGRLKPNVSLASAQADLQVIATGLAKDYPESNGDLSRIVSRPELDEIVGDRRAALNILFAAVAAVLLIACANVAGLLLAAASRRKPEIGVMAAIGATRGAILRQMLTESLLLSVIGGAVGVLLAVWILEALRWLMPATLPRFEHVAIDNSVLIFSLAISIGTGIVFGIVPAWKISRVDPLTAMREHARATMGRHPLQSWLVVAETALGLVLLTGSGLLIRSFLHVLSVNPGFDARNTLAVNLSVPENRYPHDKRLQIYEQLSAKLSAMPGVETVALGWPLPLSRTDFNIGFDIAGRPTPKGKGPSEHMGVATPGFFRSMGIPLLAGRDFSAADDVHAAGVMIVNDAFAKKYFPGESAIGKHVKPGLSDGTYGPVMREIVGVVGDVKRSGLTIEADPQYYLPWAQALITWPAITIHSKTNPENLTSAVRAAVAAVDPNIPVYRVSTLESIVSQASAEPRFQTFLLTSFAGMALLLAAIGLYGVLSYMVVQRAGEMAVRIALGAQRQDVLKLVVSRGALLAITGIAIGLAAAALVTRGMSGMLYGVRPLDPVTLISVSAILLLVSLATSFAPAYRAARLDPMRVLRNQ